MADDGRPDVLGSGREERDGLLSRVPDAVVRLVAIGAAGVIALVLLTQSGLLSAAPPQRAQPRAEPGPAY